MRRMKPVLLISIVGFPLGGFAAEDLPKPFAIARYQPMMDHSPFAVATKVAAAPESPNFAKDLYVANAARSKDGDMVTIASQTDKNFKKYLITGIAVDGYVISNIEWSDKVGATKVTITKDGQSATLGFNEALLRGPGQPGQNPPPAVPPPSFQPPGADKEKQEKVGAAPPGSASMAAPQSQSQGNQPAKPMPVPMVPTPQPKVRGVISKNPGK
jgi:hypothetical protein